MSNPFEQARAEIRRRADLAPGLARDRGWFSVQAALDVVDELEAQLAPPEAPAEGAESTVALDLDAMNREQLQDFARTNKLQVDLRRNAEHLREAIREALADITVDGEDMHPTDDPTDEPTGTPVPTAPTDAP